MTTHLHRSSTCGAARRFPCACPVAFAALICAVGLGIGGVLTARAQATGFRVASVVGAWSDGTNTPLTAGLELKVGSRIRNARPSTGDTLTLISLDDHAVQLVVHCGENERNCERVLRQHTLWSRPQPASESGTFWVIASAIWELVSEKPDEYVLFRSRGASLPDSIVTVDNNGADLAPIMMHLTSGSYVLRLRSLSPGTVAGTEWRSEPIPVTLRGESQNSTAVVPLQAGLYEITVSDTRATAGEPMMTSAWVLVVQPEDQVFARETYSAIEQGISAWEPDAAADLAPSYLRAGLHYIATQIAPRR